MTCSIKSRNGPVKKKPFPEVLRLERSFYFKGYGFQEVKSKGDPESVGQQVQQIEGASGQFPAAAFLGDEFAAGVFLFLSFVHREKLVSAFWFYFGSGAGNQLEGHAIVIQRDFINGSVLSIDTRRVFVTIWAWLANCVWSMKGRFIMS